MFLPAMSIKKKIKLEGPKYSKLFPISSKESIKSENKQIFSIFIYLSQYSPGICAKWAIISWSPDTVGGNTCHLECWEDQAFFVTAMHESWVVHALPPPNTHTHTLSIEWLCEKLKSPLSFLYPLFFFFFIRGPRLEGFWRLF